MPQQHLVLPRGLPVKYTGPPLNATQNNVAIESIEIAHEGIYQVPFVGRRERSAAAGGGSAARQRRVSGRAC